MFHKCLAGKPYPQATRETQLSPSVLTLRIPVMCRPHASFRGMLSRELPAKTLLSSIALVFTLSLSITQPLQLNPTINIWYKRKNKITIKFGTKLNLTKHIVVNYNFTQTKNVNYQIQLMMSKIVSKLHGPHVPWTKSTQQRRRRKTLQRVPMWYWPKTL